MFAVGVSMYPKLSTSVIRRIERNATTLLVSGVLICCGIVCALTICNMPCDDTVCLQRTNDRGYSQDTHKLRSNDRDEKQDLAKIRNKEQIFPKKNVSVVVLILTSPKNFEQRNAIRETWLTNIPKNVVTYFVIGIAGIPLEQKATLEYEYSMHKDTLLLADLQDSYFALTEKVLQTFAWVEQNLRYDYVLKVDDDTYTRIDIITQELHSDNLPKARLYWGFFDGRARVKRRGQWAEKKWILCDRYSPHALGGGYVLSHDLVSFIVTNAHLLQKFNSEDVSVGTWLGALDIHRVHDVRFDTEWQSRGCSNKYFITHKQDIDQIKQKHKNLKTTGKICSQEVKYKLSYVYNWNVDPSRCCIRNDSSVP